jgi:HD-GYP domain-containing protein (c-di-GMP phosphodiesterase class II)
MKNSNERYMGKQLKQDLLTNHGVIVVPAMTILDKGIIRLIQLHGISLEQHDVQAASDQIVAQEVLDSGALYMEELFSQVSFTRKIPLLEIREEIVPLVHQVTLQPDFFNLFDSLQSQDDYTYRHNIAVGVLSTVIGRWLELKESDLFQLTIAATLHDIGKVKVPLDILMKPGKLTAEEVESMRKHTTFGYEMLKETVGINHEQALVALQHHERQDGSGYPLGLKGDRITFFSRIIAVADVFHAMTSDRPYRKASPFYETLTQINDHTFGELDPRISRLFIHKMMQSMIGHEVLLTDNRSGVIVMINPHDPLRPLVNIDEQFLDLSKDSSIQIVQVSPRLVEGAKGRGTDPC